MLFQDNPAIISSWFERLPYMIVTNGFFSVDTFFLLRFEFFVSTVSLKCGLTWMLFIKVER
jgi:hypothetical protein